MTKRLLIISLAVTGLIWPLTRVAAATIVPAHTYAWSNNVGYVNFSNVIVTSATLSGYAWSTNKGYINLAPASQGGVINNGSGKLSGSAWGEQLGWIDFSHVTISAQGKFSGTATGPIIGTLTFDCPTFCNVVTNWRPATTTLPPTPTPTPVTIPTPTPTPIQTPTTSALFDVSSTPTIAGQLTVVPFVTFSISGELLLIVAGVLMIDAVRKRRARQLLEAKISEVKAQPTNTLPAAPLTGTPNSQ